MKNEPQGNPLSDEELARIHALIRPTNKKARPGGYTPPGTANKTANIDPQNYSFSKHVSTTPQHPLPSDLCEWPGLPRYLVAELVRSGALSSDLEAAEVVRVAWANCTEIGAERLKHGEEK